MKIIRTADYQKMSAKAAELILEKIRSNPQLTLGLATGSTPEGLYEELIRDHREKGTSYQSVHTVNLDEYTGIKRDDPNSYYYFMSEHLFEHIDIPAEQTHLPNGSAENLDAECSRYEKVIEQLGGVDVQVLGIGVNGHIGFNEPGTSFDSRTHIVELDESTRKANARFFNSLDEVPTHAITMGIRSILDSKEIILLASGESKAEAIARLVGGEVDEEFPASALKQHQNVTIIADQDALKLI